MGRTRSSIIPILQGLQAELRYLPEVALRRVCEITDIRPADITGVATFYDQFRFEPLGRTVLRVCHGTACHVKGSDLIQKALDDHLGIPEGGDTDPLARHTVQKVACLGCCTLAPVVQSEHATFGMLNAASVGGLLEEVERAAAVGAASADDTRATRGGAAGEIRVGLGSCCVVKGTQDLFDLLRAEVARAGVEVEVRGVGCVVACYRTPVVEVLVPGREPLVYDHVTPDDAAHIVRDNFRPRGVLRRVRAAASSLIAPLVGEKAERPAEFRGPEARDPHVTAFLGKQVHVATEGWGVLDPVDFDQGVEWGGFEALGRVLAETPPASVIEEVERSGLRGRGGGGFPTAKKWSFARDAAGDHKTVICNGDEGDPGAFMDRMILESFPYRVIEGLTIAAYAVGARDGIFYVREEYPLAFQRIQAALDTVRSRGWLGDDVQGSGFDFDVRVVQGAGAFVCGEETALIASLEGRRGMPVLRPPYPVEEGLERRPTVVNNVETLALLPWILRNGAEAFAALGTERSRGTKVFSLAGKVARGGLIEVPMGITIREVVEEVGGGVPDGEFKAVQVGGPSGGCIPATLADTPIDYEALVDVGAMMGSGGLVVLDTSDCMVDLARYFLEFTQNESCGKCTFCRIGTRQMLDVLERICRGKGRKRDLDDLEALARTTRSGSLCGLGHAAPNPVLTTLRYFRDEYEAHLEGRCPAGRCSGLISYHVTDACTGCTICVQNCPADAIPFTPYRKHEIDATACTVCDVCRNVCPEDAIDVRSLGGGV